MVFKSVEPGLERAYDPLISYFNLLNKVQIVERILEAAKEGCDGAVVGCFLDPGVSEARSAVDIPVIGIAESSLFYACLLGLRFGIVVPNERSATLEVELTLRRHGLQDRAIQNPIRCISIPSYEAFTKGMQDPSLVTADIVEKAKGCVEDGADVVIVGCNGFGPLITKEGISFVDESKVPVLDAVATGIKVAEFLCHMQHGIGLATLSRERNPLAREKDINRVRTLFGMR
jgi:allantoin racemase